MANPLYTHAVLLVDRSTSMTSMRQDAQDSINRFMKDQSNGEGIITISLYDFSSGTATTNLTRHIHYGNTTSSPSFSNNNAHRLQFGPIDPAEAPEYVLTPYGNTALLDAMAGAIDDTGKWLATLPEAIRPGSVVFATITDGDENDSRVTTREQLRNKVKTQTEVYKWEFVFFGANIDAFAAGRDLGIETNVQYQGTGASFKGAYDNFSSSLLSARSTNTTVASNMPITNVDSEGNAS